MGDEKFTAPAHSMKVGSFLFVDEQPTNFFTTYSMQRY